MNSLQSSKGLLRWAKIVIVIAVIVAATFLVLKYGGWFDKVATFYVARGDQAASEGAYTRAMQEYTYALSLENLDGNTAYEAYLKRGTILLRKRNYDEAIGELERAVRLRAKRSEAYLMLGQALLAVNRADEAETVLQKAAERSPSDPSVLRTWGLALFRQGHQDTAEQTLNQAVDLDPENQAGYFYLALAVLKRSPTEALSWLEKTLNFSGGVTTLAQRAQERTLDYIQKQQEGKGATGEAYLKVLLGWIYAEADENLVASQLADEALLAVSNYRDGWILKGWAAVQLEDFDTASAALEKAAEIDSTCGQIFYLQATVAHAQRRNETAATLYQKALDLGYDQTTLHVECAQLLAEQDNLAGAEQQWRAAFEKDARDPEVAMQLIWFLGHEQGQSVEALSIAKHLNQDMPSSRTRTLVALALALSGENEEALNLANQVLAQDALNALAYYVRGLSGGNPADYEKAIDRDFDGVVAGWAREEIE